MKNFYLSYEEEKENLLKEYESTESFLEVNEVLNKYGWHFINPYMQVFKITSLMKEEKNGSLNQEKVNSFFINEFYDLSLTLSFVDGYFKRSQFISPYNYFIESSLILCFQKDYAGAINLIIPVIEGSISSYIKEYRGIDLNEGNRYDKIKRAINQIKNDILLNIKKEYEISLHNKQQIKQLLCYHRKYYDNWVCIIDAFFKKSLFAHTSDNPSNNTLNRHSILHLLEIKNYNSLENYIKLFNSLKFLVWLFLQLEKKSILNNIDDETFMNKRVLYEELIKRSDEITPIKHALLKVYNLNNKSDFSLISNYTPIDKELSIGGKISLYLQRHLLMLSSKSELKK
ncbi:hypothetical protein ACE939_12335 [Aquimarina sp. W85]|uniref:hypothetical protein n=1 Tax=Aquimarina rhodophyticola TaxID=3342246 RepID=UPI003672BEEA